MVYHGFREEHFPEADEIGMLQSGMQQNQDSEEAAVETEQMS